MLVQAPNLFLSHSDSFHPSSVMTWHDRVAGSILEPDRLDRGETEPQKNHPQMAVAPQSILSTLRMCVAQTAPESREKATAAGQ